MPQQEQSTIIRRSHSNLCLLSLFDIFVCYLVCHLSFFYWSPVLLVTFLVCHLPHLLFVLSVVLVLCHLRLSSVFVIFVRSVHSLSASITRRFRRALVAYPLLASSFSSIFISSFPSLSSFVVFVHYLRFLSSFVTFVICHITRSSSFLFIACLVCRLPCLSFSSFVICVVCCPHSLTYLFVAFVCYRRQSIVVFAEHKVNSNDTRRACRMSRYCGRKQFSDMQLKYFYLQICLCI